MKKGLVGSKILSNVFRGFTIFLSNCNCFQSAYMPTSWYESWQVVCRLWHVYIPSGHRTFIL